MDVKVAEEGKDEVRAAQERQGGESVQRRQGELDQGADPWPSAMMFAALRVFRMADLLNVRPPPISDPPNAPTRERLDLSLDTFQGSLVGFPAASEDRS